MNLEEIEARLAAATRGPWKLSERNPIMGGRNVVIRRKGVPGILMQIHSYGFTPNPEFIEHAPEDIAVLLAEVKRLQAQIDAVKALHCQDAVQPRYCAECSDFGTDQFPAGELIEWPCPTLLAFHGDES